MAGIQKRTVFMVNDTSHTNDVRPSVGFLDWATCATSVGTCVEPFIVNQKATVGNGYANKFDSRDQMSMINKIDVVDSRGALINLLIGDAAPRLHSLDPQVPTERT